MVHCLVPRQHSASCECAESNLNSLTTSGLPRCEPTALCDSSHARRAPALSVPDGATFLVAYGFNRSHVRYWYRADPFRSYLNAMRLLSRLLLSLRAVGSTLPVHALLSGERHAGFEAALRERLALVGLGHPPLAFLWHVACQ